MITVRDILDTKGRDIWRVRPDDTVFDAVRQLADRSIGALLVMDSERLVGIVTERDYARKVILEGKSSRSTTVREVMTTKVLYAKPGHTIDECLALMTEIRARHLPVLDGERIVGIVSIGDLVKAKIQEQEILIDQLKHYIAG